MDKFFNVGEVNNKEIRESFGPEEIVTDTNNKTNHVRAISHVVGEK